MTIHPIPDKFKPHVGNNHLRLPAPKWKRGGGVSFTRHINKPLSNELWEDLVDRMHIMGMNIVCHNCSEWTIGRGDGWVSIYLNEDYTVNDIYYHPHSSYQFRGGSFG